MPNAYPSKDPASDSVPGAFEEIYRKLAMKNWGQLPARVISYDRKRGLVKCQPLIMVLHTDGTTTSRAEIAEVPVLALGGGKVVLTFDLQEGDLGWIEASSRDISNFMQFLGESRPASIRLNALEDSRFVPDCFRNYTLSDEASGHAVLQSIDGGTYIAINDGHISVKTGGTLDVQAETLNGSATNISLSGIVNISGQLIINGIDFSTHMHTSAAPGDPTSEPIPQ